MKSMKEEVKTIRLKPDGSGYTVSAGQTDVSSTIVDMQGFEGVRFLVGFGAITSGAATSIKLQQDTDSAGGTMADLEGSSITVGATDDGLMAMSEIIRPRERYVRVKTLRATQDSVIDFAIAELFGARSLPVTQPATVLSSETASSPAEGTA